MTAERSRFRIQADLAEIARVRQRLGDFLAESTLFDEHAQAQLVLALDEAATNIVRHGYPSKHGVIDVEFEQQEATLWIRLWDDGIAREEKDCIGLPPGVPGEGGMGLNLMRSMLDSLDFRRDGGRNLLVMSRRATSLEKEKHGREEA